MASVTPQSVCSGLTTSRVDLSDEVEEILGRIKPKSASTGRFNRTDGEVAALDKLHAKHVLPGFTDRTAEEREIERQTADITRVRTDIVVLRAVLKPGRTSGGVPT